MNEARAQIKDLYPEDVAVGIMAPKTLHFNILVENVRTPIAIILKESMLSCGGDAAIHREAITCKVKRCDVLLMGTLKQIRNAMKGMKMQPFGGPELAEEILSAAENFHKTPEPWVLPNGKELSFDETRIMGIINVTPDSFSGDGIENDSESAVKLALEMEKNGADMIDIGGESTRPGSEPVSEKEEKSRVLPVIENLANKLKIPISIDTMKPEVAQAAIEAGASIVNDITGLSDENMITLCSEKKVPVIIMHMKGTPKTMQDTPQYDDVIGEIMRFLSDRRRNAIEGGIDEKQIAMDPGIGFGKRLEDNLEIIRRLAEFKTLGCPIALGVSRKSFIGKIIGLSVDQRLEGSLAAECIAAINGANIIRCHDVKETSLALKITAAIKNHI